MPEPSLIYSLQAIGTAIACGALIGGEREWTRHDAGLRTNALVAAGACIFGLLSTQVFGATETGDPGRVAAQVVSGIGFIGAGVIIQRRARVIGLTTAATLWVAAAVGLAAGGGAFVLAWTSALAVLGIQILLRLVETRLDTARARTRGTPRRFRLELQAYGDPPKHLERMFSELQNRSSLRLHEATLTPTSEGDWEVTVELGTLKKAEIREAVAHLALAGVTVLKVTELEPQELPKTVLE